MLGSDRVILSRATRFGFRLLSLHLATTALTSPLLIASAYAQSLPTGGQVAAGQVAIAQPSATQMNVTQTSQNAVVNWQSFSVAHGSTVNFVQPSASAAILNRVTSNAPSTIAGSITANGQVYLVNPNGIAITATGTVNAGGFVASSLGISDSDFMSGKRTFTGNGASAAVSNAGTISVGRGGYAALIGGEVENSGSIHVPLGKVGLGSGEQATLDFSGDGFLQVAVPTGSNSKAALVSNSGKIKTNGGSVILTAATAPEATRTAINMSGTVQARSISGRNGSISIGGGAGGKVAVSGRISTASRRAKGGKIEVAGKEIALTGATLDASGKTGGGTINIGGDYQGKGPLLRADRTSIDAATAIKADATGNGNGGNVVVWSDNYTTYAGTITARGGAEGGNGGDAEVSGKALLQHTGFTDLSAAKGSFGTLLLDPYNITISNGTAANSSGISPTGNNSVINANTLITALDTANVWLTTDTGGTQEGNITIQAPLTWAPARATSLTFNAAGNIVVTQPIVARNSAFGLVAGKNIAINSDVSVPDGLLHVKAGGTITATGDINTEMFVLSSGDWVQTSTTRPAFYAQDFQLLGGTFLRTLGPPENSADPHRIYDIYGLQGIGTFLQNEDVSFKIMNDIDASSTRSWHFGAGFKPIGQDLTPFSGSFDGGGHKINALTINRPNENEVGLFGRAYLSSALGNVHLVDANVVGASTVGALVGVSWTAHITSSSATGDVRGTENVGGLVGYLLGSNVSDSFADVNVTGTSSTGGLVGAMWGANLYQVYAAGTVSGGAPTGGLVGFMDQVTSIYRAYASGAVSGTEGVGGLVGVIASTTLGVKSAYATGSVTGHKYVGGLLGWTSVGTEQVYASGTVTGSEFAGPLVGEVNLNVFRRFRIHGYYDSETNGLNLPDAVGVGLTTAQARTSSAYTGFDFENEWFQIGDMRPIGRWEAAAPVNGVIPVSNLHQLQLIQSNPGANYVLTRDIDASETKIAVAGSVAGVPTSGVWGPSGFESIRLASNGGFNKTLDGNGYAISNLYIYQPAEVGVGLFSSMGASGTITDLGLIDANIKGREKTGALVGHNSGTIRKSYATGAVKGDTITGGLVGYNEGTIEQAYADVAVSVTGNKAGGLVGQNNLDAGFERTGTLKQVYATGTVHGTNEVGGLVGYDTSGEVSEAFATGHVTANEGADRIGGLFGLSVLSNISASYWDTESTGQTRGSGNGVADPAGISGRTTAQMQDAVNFATAYAGFDFSSTWLIPASGYYPSFGVGGIMPVLVVKPISINREYGSNNPELQVTYQGLQSGHSIREAAILTTDATSASDVGTYSISVTNAVRVRGASYRIVYEVGTLVIDPRLVMVASITGIDKVYDGTTSLAEGLPQFTLSNVIAGDVVSLAASSAVYDSKNAGTRTIRFSDLTLSGSSADNYILSGDVAASGTISKRALTATAAVQDKVYDGTVGATVTLSDNRISEDTLNFNYDSSFADKNAGTNKTVTVSGITLSGVDAGNYTANTTATTTAPITPRALTVTATGVDRAYDGTTVATANLGDNRITGDTLSIGYSASFADKNAGTNKTVTVSGITLSGADAGNYTVNTTVTTTASILQRMLMVSADAQSRIVMTDNSALTYRIGGDGLVAGETLNGALTTIATRESDVGQYAITQGTLAASSNYVLTFIPALLSISQPVAMERVLRILHLVWLTAQASQLIREPPQRRLLMNQRCFPAGQGGVVTVHADPRFDGALVCVGGFVCVTVQADGSEPS